MASTLNDGALLVTPGARLPFTELTRSGGGWTSMNLTGAVPLAVLPTTLCIGEWYNNSNNTSVPMVMEVESLSAFRLLGTAAANALAIWAQVTAPKAAPTNGAVVVGSLSGRAPYTTAAGARVLVGNGTTVIASGWRPWGTSPMTIATEAALPGASWIAEVNGKYLVPPGCSLCITVVGEGATGTCNVGATWYETPVSQLSVVA